MTGTILPESFWMFIKNMPVKKLSILGIRGIPARHGGFETFAEKLSLYRVGRGWEVTVYCQEESAAPIWKSNWQGIERIHVPVMRQGVASTVIFDWLATRDRKSVV